MEKIEEIMEKAKWCLNCKAKPCSTSGCPMNTNIPEFISQIKEENFEEAYKILLDNNIFSHVCSLVCPQEDQCEGKCVRSIKQTPTKIGELEKFINEWAIENKIEYKIAKSEKNGKKVAIVGSGPAGIECAIELLKNGYDVTIFEKRKKREAFCGTVSQIFVCRNRLLKRLSKKWRSLVRRLKLALL